MKAFLALLLGVAIGAVAVWYFMGTANDEKLKAAHDQLGNQARLAGDALQEQLRSLHLSAEDIKNELERTGRVIRENAQKAGRAISDASADARVTAAIKAKLVRDPELSAWNISVATTDGIVTISGSVSTPEQVGKAMLLALETNGARQVISTLQVKPPKPS